MNRRAFLGSLGLGGFAPTALAAVVFPAAAERAPKRAPTLQGEAPSPDVELALSARPGTAQIRQGPATRVWTYDARVLKGPSQVVQALPDSYLGPTLRLRTGQKVRVHFTNHLPEPTIVHWHGLHVPENADGHPRLVVPSGASYLYDFEVINRPGTYWYHPHHHDRTGPQVYNGLAGGLIVSDDAEAALGLPTGDEDLLCVIQDRRFDADNQFRYVGGMPMEHMTGFLGDEVLVNGRVQPTLRLATRAYRLRLLNGSNSRIYKLAWDDRTVITVIGTDGGLLEHPLERPYLTLAPGERIDIVLDLTRRAVGTRLTLKSLPFSGVQIMGMGGMGMGGMRRGSAPGGGSGQRGNVGGARNGQDARGGMGMMSGAGLANGAELTIFSVEVDRRLAGSSFQLPSRLSTFDDSWRREAAGQERTRTISVTMQRMEWLLDDRRFGMDEVADDERVPLGSKQIWEFVNPASGMMRMAHPIHLHGPQYRVLERRVDGGLGRDWAALSQGFTDEGWKDTFLMMPGERVKILVHFRRYPGLFLYHCHNLEHEDMGMMRNYRVV